MIWANTASVTSSAWLSVQHTNDNNDNSPCYTTSVWYHAIPFVVRADTLESVNPYDNKPAGSSSSTYIPCSPACFVRLKMLKIGHYAYEHIHTWCIPGTRLRMYVRAAMPCFPSKIPLAGQIDRDLQSSTDHDLQIMLAVIH